MNKGYTYPFAVGLSLSGFKGEIKKFITLCTRLALTGMPVSVIQEIMGDSTQDVVLGIYTHVTNEQALKAHSGYCENSNLSEIF